jgi:3-oxoacyl-[acyl-carrier protein] reductase
MYLSRNVVVTGGGTGIANALGELPETVDVLVNNAGGNTDFLREDDADLASLDGAWTVNFRATCSPPR